MNLVPAILLVAAMTPTSQPLDYNTAYNQAMKGDKPLLVLVTAEWCQPCQVMKTRVLPELLKRDAFSDYYFATVDFDQQQKLAKKLVKDRGIPQLILYEKNDQGNWKIRYLSGAQSVDVVENFLHGQPERRTADASAMRSIGK